MKYRVDKSREHYFEVMKNLKSAVCTYYRIPINDLFKKSRKTQVSYPRHIFHYLAHDRFGIPSNVVGLFSKREHATVLHSKKQVLNWLGYDRALRVQVDEILSIYKKPTKIKMISMVIKESLKDIYKIIKWRAA